MRSKEVILALIIYITTFVYLFYFSNQEPSLSQETSKSSKEKKIIYELGVNDEPTKISDDSTYYELRTRYGNIRLTDIGTQHEIDSIRPIRAKTVVKLYREYQELNSK